MLAFSRSRPSASADASPAPRTLLVLATLLSLTACGGGDGSSEAGTRGTATASTGLPDLDACALVTAAEASEALGSPASQPEGYTKLDRVDEQMGAAMSNCLYADPSYRTVSVVVTYRSSEQPATFDALKADAATATGAAAEANMAVFNESEAVDGLGDFAFWLEDGSTLTVYARRHYQVVVSVDPEMSGEGARAAAIRLARRALERL